VRLDQAYLFQGFPTEGLFYHGVALDVNVLVLPRLQVFVEGVAAFGKMHGSGDLRLDNRQFHVGLGIGYTAVQAGPFALMPAVGFRLAISQSTASFRDQDRHFTALAPAAWLGFETRFAVTSWFAVLVGASLDFRFKDEAFRWSDDVILRIPWLDLGVVAGMCVTI
jgi:hypothetical protein